MSKTRPSITLNDSVLSTLRAGVEVSYEPHGVDPLHLLVLLVCGNIEWLNAESSLDGVPPPIWHRATNRSAVDGKTNDHDDVLQRHRGLVTRKMERVDLWMPSVHKVLSTRRSPSSTDRR
jgi:hypothetical protein